MTYMKLGVVVISLLAPFGLGAQELPVRVVDAPDGKKLVIHCGDWTKMVETSRSVGYERFIDLVEKQFGKKSYHAIIAGDAAGYGLVDSTSTYAQVQGYCIVEADKYWSREAARSRETAEDDI